MKRTIRVSVSRCSFAFDSDCCSDTLASDLSVMWILRLPEHCRPAYPCPSVALCLEVSEYISG